MEEIKFGFEDLELWKKSREFKNDVYNETKIFPPKRNFD
jgi:hypothetical protein